MSVPYPKALEDFPTLRQSLLATFDRCALSAKFDFDHRRTWSSHAQARGQIFHRVAAKALRQMVELGEQTIETDVAVAILDETLRQHDVDRHCPHIMADGSVCGARVVARTEEGRIVCDDGHDHSSEFVNLPISEVKDLRWVVVKWAHDNAFDIDGLVDIEKRLSAAIRYPDEQGGSVERLLTGALDALFVTGAEDEEAIVLDWKDTWDLPAPREVGFDGYFQQRFYAYLVLRNYPSIQKVTLREFYVRYSEPREATLWRADMEVIEAELAALAERFDRAYEESHYPPSPGRHCSFCPRPGSCPIFPGVRGEGAVVDEDTARRFAAEATVAKAALKQRQDALKAWSSVHGPIPISDHKGPRVLGFRESKRTERPTREAMEAALRVGQVNLDDLYSTSKTTRFVEHQPVEEDDTADDAALMQALEQSVRQAGG